MIMFLIAKRIIRLTMAITAAVDMLVTVTGIYAAAVRRRRGS